MRCGADAADAILVSSEGITANVFDGEVDSFVKSLSRGAGVRALVGGRVGYAYTENLNEIQSIAQSAVESARISDVTEGAGIYLGAGAQDAAQPPPLDQSEAVRKTALTLYEAVMGQGAHSVQACEAESVFTQRFFANSAGLFCMDSRKMASIFAEPVAKKDAYTDSNYAFAVGARMGDLDIDFVAQKAMRRAMAYYGAQRAAGGAVPVVIEAETMANLLGAFAPAFSAENAQKGLSLLKGKEGGTHCRARHQYNGQPPASRYALSVRFRRRGRAHQREKCRGRRRAANAAVRHRVRQPAGRIIHGKRAARLRFRGAHRAVPFLLPARQSR